MKPYEVELLLAQVGETPERNELYRISFDGSIMDERRFTAIGGRSDAIMTLLRKESSESCPSLKDALTLCQHAFEKGPDPRSGLEGLEVALLDRTRKNRKFRRVPTLEASQILA
jgi:proteasome alpha subunit